jgi:hypothetical protein
VHILPRLPYQAGIANNNAFIERQPLDINKMQVPWRANRRPLGLLTVGAWRK